VTAQARDDGTAPLSTASLDLALLAKRVCEHLLPLALARAQSLILTAQYPVIVRGIESDLERLIRNLVENAIRYTPPERRPEIHLGTRTSDGWTECWVEDNGVGIPLEDRDSVFALFKRLDDGRRLQANGTGLGLAIVARIVNAHGGRVWIEDGRDGGTAFHFTLPAAPAAPEGLLQPSAPSKSVRHEGAA